MAMDPALDWVRKQLVENRLRRSSLLVYLALLSRCRVDESGRVCCRPAARELAEQTELSRHTVSVATGDLEQRGLIRVFPQWNEYHARAENFYVLLELPPGWQGSN